MADLSKTYIFRIIHIENIPHILRYGITHVTSPHANTNYVPIGDARLITNRSYYITPNGNSLSQYIPFYFGVRMPMLYVIQKGFNGVNATPPVNIVYCILTVQQIIDHQLPFVFTNGHAIDGLTEYFDASGIEQLDHIIDKNAIAAKYWKDENDLDLKRRKEAEFLVAKDIPPTAIVGWVVYNQQAKDTLLEAGIADSKIIVKPEYYF
jgi:hypothetical protein